MQEKTATQLIKLNYKFYQTFSESFSATRQRLQSGVMQVIKMLPENATILDLGCGNGNFALELAQQNFQGSYTGIDFSEDLVQIAQDQNNPHFSFSTGDLTSDNWDDGLVSNSYDFILSFATMHHLPGKSSRLNFLNKVHALLKPNGQFIHSNWQFLNSESLKARIQPWDRIDLNQADVDEGDYLMDWRRGGEGLRYVHQYSSEELHHLAEHSGFKVINEFSSDGRTGNLGLYMIWEKLN